MTSDDGEAAADGKDSGENHGCSLGPGCLVPDFENRDAGLSVSCDRGTMGSKISYGAAMTASKSVVQ